jgi:glycosyltransferase involved in cell wall biosynthesis
MKLKYCGPVFDYSGYGEACRHDVKALVNASVNVTIEAPSYTLETSDYGELGLLCKNLQGKDIGYRVKIIHTTPNVYPQFFEKDKYHIGRVFWETDCLPKEFAMQVQLCDEIWTGSKQNLDAIKRAGVTKPIYIIPESIDTDIDVKKINPFHVLNDNTYKFYSIFEWIDRKNPLALLEAYWSEFTNGENVSLTLKTYRNNFMKKNYGDIEGQIRLVKKKLQYESYAPVYIYRHLMDRNQIYRFHKTFDCFVSTHRGEGWGIPQMEAMLLEKPIISTNIGGIHEYMTDYQEGILIPYNLVNITGDVRNKEWYTHEMQWADIDIGKLRKAMRYIYENQKKGTEMGLNGKSLVLKMFSPKSVGKQMAERLKDIQKDYENTLH